MNDRIEVDREQAGTESASDEQLLAGFLAGDDKAFSALVERYGQELFQFVARFVRSTAAAEDIVQETFIQVYQAAAGFDSSRRFRPWMFTIAANKARDFLRGRSRKKEVPLSTASSADSSEEVSYLDFLSDASSAPGEKLEADERRDVVRSIVSRMPDHLREVLVLGYYHRFPYREIAEVLSIPLGTVKSRLHAAVSCFATAYRREEEDRSPGSP
jgi:RNA polymerase sigma-70 factor (ECF subfamily)